MYKVYTIVVDIVQGSIDVYTIVFHENLKTKSFIEGNSFSK
jgi:hypothetical protein